jgi:hypothetical protein
VIACADRGIPCVFTSSEQVFDGTQAPRPPNLSMDSTIALGLGLNPQDFQSGLLTICDRL